MFKHQPELTDKQKPETYDGRGHQRCNLFIIKISDTKWYVGREEGIRAPEILSATMSNWEYDLCEPIIFATYKNAEKWCQTGCIADLQETLSWLAVGFATTLMTKRKQPYGMG